MFDIFSMRVFSSVLHFSMQNKILERLRDKLIVILCAEYTIQSKTY
jgi:hypothetical protein